MPRLFIRRRLVVDPRAGDSWQHAPGMGSRQRIAGWGTSAFVAAPAALFACGLTADYSGLQAGGDAGAPIDSAAPTYDGGADTSAPAPGFCATRSPAPRLCADFDEGLPVESGWTILDRSDNATLKVDSTGFMSQSSMLSGLTPDDAPGFARLHQSIPLQTTNLHIEFAMLLPNGGGPFELVAIHQSASLDSPDDYGLFYKEEKGNLLAYLDTLEEDGGVGQFVYPLGAPPAQWLQVTIDFVFGNPGSLKVTHDGAVVIDKPAIPTATSGAKQLFVAVGLYSPNGATARANFDNVIVNWP